MKSPKTKASITEAEENFIVVFYRLIQSIRLYQHKSQIVKEYTAHFTGGLEKLIGDEEFIMHFSKGLIRVQGEKLTFRRDNLAVFQRMMSFFEDRGLEGLIFYPEIKEIGSDELINFFNLLIEAETHDSPWDWLAQQKKRVIILGLISSSLLKSRKRRRVTYGRRHVLLTGRQTPLSKKLHKNSH